MEEFSTVVEKKIMRGFLSLRNSILGGIPNKNRNSISHTFDDLKNLPPPVRAGETFNS